jgi:sensory rhodopsin
MVSEVIWYGTGAGVFFTSVVAFLWFATTRGSLGTPFYYLPPIHASIAGTAYVAMTLVATGVVPAVLDVSIFRFADWTLSTPIITYYLARLAGVTRQTRWLAIATNVGMIASGYGYVALTGPLRWAAFTVSTGLFVVLVFLFLRTFDTALETAPGTVRSLFVSLRDLTVVTWSLYPIVYIVGPFGLGLIQSADLNFVVTVLDVIAKVGFMSVLVVRYYSVDNFLGEWSPVAAE